MPRYNSVTKRFETTLVLVGACAVDTILTVPYFPDENAKLRAVSSIKRRGGNCPNILEVLHQLVQLERAQLPSNENSQHEAMSSTHAIDSLVLISTMPSRDSSVMPFIYDSFSIPGKESKVDFALCVHRSDHVDPISSYIISSQTTGSRTIVNHNALPEMTFTEFEDLINSSYLPPVESKGISTWFHFEGRIPDTTLCCILFLRQLWETCEDSASLIISVELEKPGRDGLQRLAYEADIVFYSRSWAEGEGYTSAAVCLVEQTQLMIASGSHRPQRTLICTWDTCGACGITIPDGAVLNQSDVIHSAASDIADSDVVDSVGAGDTFIAAMLFAMLNRSSQWSLGQKLDFANALAGRKIVQQGFSGLAEQFIARLRL